MQLSRSSKMSTCFLRDINIALNAGFVVVCELLSKLTFSKNSFMNAIRVANSLEPDQDRHYVSPDLGPNCFQMLSADDKSCCEHGKS